MALSTPDSEPRLFSGPGAGLRLILLATLAVALMWLDHRNQHLAQIRSLLAATLYPLQQAVDAPFSATRWARENFASRATLIRENEEFRKTLLAQNGRLQRMAALEAENARMRALLDSTAKLRDQLLIAEIVSVDMDRLRHRVVLNRGSRDGAFVGQALIDATGVVGQITRDRGTSSEALLITDPDHAVPVEVVRNGLRTIALGTGDLERLSLPFMARNADVRPGDLLVSSGLGARFPSGYPVATVSDVRGDSGEPFLVVSASPTAALDRVREVLLVKPREAAEPGTEDVEAAGTGTAPETAPAPEAATSEPRPTPTPAPPATAEPTDEASAAPAAPEVGTPADTGAAAPPAPPVTDQPETSSAPETAPVTPPGSTSEAPAETPADAQPEAPGTASPPEPGTTGDTTSAPE